MIAYGMVEMKPIDSNKTFSVDGQRIKHYYRGVIKHKQTFIVLKVD